MKCRGVGRVHVASNLALSSTELLANISRFNPQRALSNTKDETVALPDHPDPAPDAEVSFVTRDLVTALPRTRLAALLPMEQVHSRRAGSRQLDG